MLKFTSEFIEADLYPQPKTGLNGTLVTGETPSSYSLTQQGDSARVSPEMKKPRFDDQGFEAEKGRVITPILAADQIRDNSNEFLIAESSVSYTSNGYIRLPRSLLDHPGFSGAHVIHQRILLKIIELARFRESEFNDQGHVLKIEVGEVCISVRSLAEKCGKGCSKNWVTGAISVFSAHQFLRQRVGHQRLILMITHPETYDLIKNEGRTASQTAVRQQSDTKEDLKNIKNIKKKEEKNTRRTAVATEDGLRRATLLFQQIRKKKENYPEPKFETWAHDIDLLHTQDQVDWSRIDAVLDWLPTHHFWWKVMRSGNGFRRNFISAEVEMESTLEDEGYRQRASICRTCKAQHPAQFAHMQINKNSAVNVLNQKEVELRLTDSERFKKEMKRIFAVELED